MLRRSELPVRGRASDGRVIPEIGSADKSSDPVELYPTPAALTVGRLQFATARYMTDYAKLCPRPGEQNNVASDGRYDD